MKPFFLFLFLGIAMGAAAQSMPEARWAEAMARYQEFDNSSVSEATKDSLWNNVGLALAEVMQGKNGATFAETPVLPEDGIFRFEKHVSEDGEWLTYSLGRNLGEAKWNYLAKAQRKGTEIDGHQIVLKNTEAYSYFVEVHSLAKGGVLLLERMDDLVFTCYYARVYITQNETDIHPVKAFYGKERLSLCTFTQTEEPLGTLPSEPGELPQAIYGIQSHEPRAFFFETSTQTLGYTGMDGKMYRATYKNGKFKLKDSDERMEYP